MRFRVGNIGLSDVELSAIAESPVAVGFFVAAYPRRKRLEKRREERICPVSRSFSRVALDEGRTGPEPRSRARDWGIGCGRGSSDPS